MQEERAWKQLSFYSFFLSSHLFQNMLRDLSTFSNIFNIYTLIQEKFPSTNVHLNPRTCQWEYQYVDDNINISIKIYSWPQHSSHKYY